VNVHAMKVWVARIGEFLNSLMELQIPDKYKCHETLWIILCFTFDIFNSFSLSLFASK
jgi:hypothetical protein